MKLVVTRSETAQEYLETGNGHSQKRRPKQHLPIRSQKRAVQHQLGLPNGYRVVAKDLDQSLFVSFCLLLFLPLWGSVVFWLTPGLKPALEFLSSLRIEGFDCRKFFRADSLTIKLRGMATYLVVELTNRVDGLLKPEKAYGKWRLPLYGLSILRCALRLRLLRGVRQGSRSLYRQTD